jgi:hypothetical protein
MILILDAATRLSRVAAGLSHEKKHRRMLADWPSESFPAGGRGRITAPSTVIPAEAGIQYALTLQLHR